jgi:hypothetical protein
MIRASISLFVYEVKKFFKAAKIIEEKSKSYGMSIWEIQKVRERMWQEVDQEITSGFLPVNKEDLN